MNQWITHSKKQLTAVAVAVALAASLAVSVHGADTGATTAASPADYGLPSFRQLIASNVDSVVSIRASGTALPTNRRAPSTPDAIPEPFRRFFDDENMRRFFEQRPNGPRPSASQGSGFVISEDGYVLTNAHVVDGTSEVFVRLHDNRELVATVVGADERSDVAVLKVDATDLPAVALGESSKLQVGDWVLAIGSPFGFDYSASQGIVSAVGRSLPDGTYVPFIQTDVAVNPGNSGGPLFDLDGNVVGINSQIYSRSGGYQGLSFAIPIDIAMNVVDQIKENGHVSRGWLGVMIQDLNQSLAESFGLDKPRGALVSQVLEGSPAAKAGIEVGDVILKYDGRELQRSSALPPLVGTTAVGESAEIEVLRDGRTLTLNTVIAELAGEGEPQSAELARSGDGHDRKLGVAVANLSVDQLQDLQLSHGVLINEVQPDSPAARAGLRGGDVILSFNRKDVTSVEELVSLVEQAPEDRPVVVLVKREEGTLFVPLRLS